MPVPTIQWLKDCIRIIDQTKLPGELVYLDIRDVEILCEAIRSLRVRGAPAIGVAAAMGAALSAAHCPEHDPVKFIESVRRDILEIGKTRPTAVNLFWALDRMTRLLESLQHASVQTIRDQLLKEALAIHKEDQEICRQIGKRGARLLPDTVTVLTHCNAGGLATADYGTALGVIYAAVEAGKTVHVFADETRPLLQGARLTAWELKASGIDVTVLCDSAAGSLLRQGKVDCVIVGADRIASNGDTANKIGTYPLAVLANGNSIPFYVAAPVSTIDFTIDSGDEIPIEERSASEVTEGFGVRTVPEGVHVYNPAFDVTSNHLITAIITERGVLRPPFDQAIDALRI